MGDAGTSLFLFGLKAFSVSFYVGSLVMLCLSVGWVCYFFFCSSPFHN
jgi:hypothetical protein